MFQLLRESHHCGTDSGNTDTQRKRGPSPCGCEKGDHNACTKKYKKRLDLLTPHGGQKLSNTHSIRSTISPSPNVDAAFLGLLADRLGELAQDVLSSQETLSRYQMREKETGSVDDEQRGLEKPLHLQNCGLHVILSFTNAESDKQSRPHVCLPTCICHLSSPSVFRLVEQQICK